MSLQTGDHREIVRNLDDRTGVALGFIHKLLQSAGRETGTTEALLASLASAFGGAAAGIAFGLNEHVQGSYQVGRDGKPAAAHALPWESRPEALNEIKNSAHAVEITHNGSRSLVAAVSPAPGSSWLLWIEDHENRHWSQGERAVLPLVGQALARLAHFGNGQDFWSRALERVRLQGQVENAAALTGKLAHDFGNVLTGILGFAELTLSQLPENSLPRQYLQEVWQSARRGAQWIHKLQIFSRKSSPEAVPTRLANIIADEEARVRQLWGGSVTFVVALTPDLPLVALDAESLKQIVAALLDNAREAIDGQGVVTLSARTTELAERDCLDLIGNTQPGQHVEITITDSGRGLSEDTRARLFAEPFFSTKTRHRGMGLAIVYGILRTFRGGIRIEPEAKRGTSVRLLLPTAGAGPERPGHGAPRGNGERILVVDDDRVILASVGQILHQAGYEVQTAASPAEAVAHFSGAQRKFHLIVSDVVLPDMNGCDMVKRMQEIDRGLGALFMSGRASLQGHTCEEMFKKFELLLKPFEPDDLLRAVGEALARPRAKQVIR